MCCVRMPAQTSRGGSYGAEPHHWGVAITWLFAAFRDLATLSAKPIVHSRCLVSFFLCLRRRTCRQSQLGADWRPPRHCAKSSPSSDAVGAGSQPECHHFIASRDPCDGGAALPARPDRAYLPSQVDHHLDALNHPVRTFNAHKAFRATPRRAFAEADADSRPTRA
jgi:hypothetical protein